MWLEFWVTVAVTVATLAVVGLPLAFAIGLRGFIAVALTGPIAVAVIAGTAVLAGAVGLPWSPLTLLVTVALVALVLFVLARRFGKAMAAPSGSWSWIGFGIAAVLIAVQVVRIFGTPGAISQTFDNVFHLNAVQFVLETADASSLHIGALTSPGGSLGFYPAAWHGVVALVVQVSGASIPIAVQAVTLVISAVIWPLGALLLVRTLVGRTAPALIGAAGVAAAMPVFPLLLLDYGVLYPYQLGLAMLPAVLAVTLWVARIGLLRIDRIWQTASILIVLIGGMTLAHPGAFVSWLALSVPVVVVLAVRFWRSGATRTRVWVAITVVAYGAAGILLLKVLRPPLEARQWPTVNTIPEAVLDVFTGATWYGVPAVLVSIAAAVGIVVALVRRTEAALVMLAFFLICAALYVVVSAGPMGPIRDALTGSWYNNTPRLAAMLAVGTVPIAAYGIAWMGERAVASKLPRQALVIGGAVVAAAALLFTQIGPLTPVPTAVAAAGTRYAETPGAALLDPDEIGLLERLDDDVPADAVIAGNPWTGTPLAYAMSNRHVLMPHILVEERADVQLVNEELRDATPGSEVCDAVDRLDVGFVLDFGEKGVHGRAASPPGLSDLEDSRAVELVDSEGDARLYRIVGCGE